MIRTLFTFAPVVTLAVLAGFVLNSPASGIAALGAMIALPLCGIRALRRQDPDGVAQSSRTGLAGWVGHGF